MSSATRAVFVLGLLLCLCLLRVNGDSVSVDGQYVDYEYGDQHSCSPDVPANITMAQSGMKFDVFAPSPVDGFLDLASARSFGILATEIINNGNSTCFGDAARWGGHDNDTTIDDSINVTGGRDANDTSDAFEAVNALQTAAGELECDNIYNTTLGANMAGRTYGPGVHCWVSPNVWLTGGDLYLDGNGDANASWVFRIDGDLVVGSAARHQAVHIINGGSACNIFWVVGGSVTVHRKCQLQGTVIANGTIALGASARVSGGGVISTNGNVTLDNAIVDNGLCGNDRDNQSTSFIIWGSEGIPLPMTENSTVLTWVDGVSGFEIVAGGDDTCDAAPTSTGGAPSVIVITTPELNDVQATWVKSASGVQLWCFPPVVTCGDDNEPTKTNAELGDDNRVRVVSRRGYGSCFFVVIDVTVWEYVPSSSSSSTGGSEPSIPSSNQESSSTGSVTPPSSSSSSTGGSDCGSDSSSEPSVPSSNQESSSSTGSVTPPDSSSSSSGSDCEYGGSSEPSVPSSNQESSSSTGSVTPPSSSSTGSDDSSSDCGSDSSSEPSTGGNEEGSSSSSGGSVTPPGNVDCQRGTYSDNGFAPCRPCPNNTYANIREHECHACPVHTHCPTGAASITECVCDEGYTSQWATGGPCYPIDSSSSGSSEPSIPSSNQESSSSGSVTPPSSSSSSSTGGSDCGSDSSSEPSVPSSNQESSSTGSVTPPGNVDCQRGTYSDNGFAPCRPCANNTYANIRETECHACPAHSSCPTGAASITECVCDEGYTSPWATGGPCYPIDSSSSGSSEPSVPSSNQESSSSSGSVTPPSSSSSGSDSSSGSEAADDSAGALDVLSSSGGIVIINTTDSSSTGIDIDPSSSSGDDGSTMPPWPWWTSSSTGRRLINGTYISGGFATAKGSIATTTVLVAVSAIFAALRVLQ